jgi:hypothetical protein
MGDTTDFDRTDRPWTAQPPPVERAEMASMHELVAEDIDALAADMRARGTYGYRKYGQRLTVGNGRDPLCDLYDELLDALVYLRQHLEERRLMQTAAHATYHLSASFGSPPCVDSPPSP